MKTITDQICKLDMFESCTIDDKEYQRVPGGLVIFKHVTEVRQKSLAQMSTSVTSIFVPMGDSYHQHQPKFEK
jgi:hypothetical protein